MTDPTTTAEVKRRASFTPNDELMDAQLRRIAKAVLDDNCLGLMWGAVADRVIAAHASARDVIDQQANRLNELSERLTAEQPSRCETESHTIKLMGATAVIRDLRAELDAANRNLTATQAECTRLLEENRRLCTPAHGAMDRIARHVLRPEFLSQRTWGEIADALIIAFSESAQALATESRKVGSQATEIDRLHDYVYSLETALNGHPKVGKRRKQLMRALGMDTAKASEHEPTWEELCERIEQVIQLEASGQRCIAALRSDIDTRYAQLNHAVGCTDAPWEEMFAKVAQLATSGANGATKSETTVQCNDPDCWVCGLNAPKPIAQTAPPPAQAAPGRAEAPLDVSADPGTGQGVLGAARGQETGTATVEQPDPCPLPEVGEWHWFKDGMGYKAVTAIGFVLKTIGKSESMPWHYWSVRVNGSQAFDGAAHGESLTRKGAMRAAEKAARRAWRIRVGRKA